MQTWNDEALLQHIQAGSHQAFTVLVERHTGRFFRIAYRFTASQEEAEEIVQEAFLKLWQHPDMWQAGKNAKFTTWFYRVVTNHSLDHKKKQRAVMLEDGTTVPDERHMQDETLICTEEQKMLEAAIQALPERQQTALNLCFYEHLSNQEAADIMGVNLKALQSLLMRAKTTLKDRLKAYW